jgi:hypothetical protein
MRARRPTLNDAAGASAGYLLGRMPVPLAEQLAAQGRLDVTVAQQ